MKKIKIAKKMKTFKWNLRNRKREKMDEIAEVNDWDEKDVEAEKEDEDNFHENVSMNHKKMKTDEWNERNKNREERKTKEEDNDWNKKEDEDKVNGENDNEFHEELYDS